MINVSGHDFRGVALPDRVASRVGPSRLTRRKSALNVRQQPQSLSSTETGFTKEILGPRPFNTNKEILMFIIIHRI